MRNISIRLEHLISNILIISVPGFMRGQMVIEVKYHELISSLCIRFTITHLSLHSMFLKEKFIY